MTDQEKIECCAKAAHELNRVYCESLGDKSQLPWQRAPEWQRQSAINGVKGALAGNTPEQSHESWLAEKRAAGWRYGPTKDPEKKQHPCMVPYGELPDEQRVKDHLFCRTVELMKDILDNGIETVRSEKLDAQEDELERNDKTPMFIEREHCPEPAEGSPGWLVDLYYKYINTGLKRSYSFSWLRLFQANLAVGQTLVGPRYEYTRTETGMKIADLGYDKNRGWSLR